MNDLGVVGESCDGEESGSSRQSVRDHREQEGNYHERNQDTIS